MFDPEDILFIDGPCCVCDRGLSIKWSDYHGEGVCVFCGTPYQVYHYNDSGRIQGALPMFALRSDMYNPLVEYWNETSEYMGLGMYFGRHPHREQVEKFYDWLDKSEWSGLLRDKS